jgi:hypothetical protein
MLTALSIAKMDFQDWNMVFNVLRRTFKEDIKAPMEELKTSKYADLGPATFALQAMRFVVKNATTDSLSKKYLKEAEETLAELELKVYT